MKIVFVVHVTLVKRNAEVKQNEHNNPTKSSESFKQYQPLFYIDCYFKCSKNAKTRNKLEASYIALRKPELKE